MADGLLLMGKHRQVYIGRETVTIFKYRHNSIK